MKCFAAPEHLFLEGNVAFPNAGTGGVRLTKPPSAPKIEDEKLGAKPAIGSVRELKRAEELKTSGRIGKERSSPK